MSEENNKEVINKEDIMNKKINDIMVRLDDLEQNNRIHDVDIEHLLQSVLILKRRISQVENNEQ
jgi:hypothetical protein